MTTPTNPSDNLFIDETFMEDTAAFRDKWTLLGDAGIINGVGLQLTPDEKHKAGSALLKTAFPSTRGVGVEFDYLMGNSSGALGDGFCIYLIDGATTDPKAGAYGAGLGYARETTDKKPGVVNGYVGIGFDAYGHFATNLAGEGGPPPSGRRPNSITVRGPGNQDKGFDFVDSKEVKDGLRATWDDKAHVRFMVLNGKVTVVLTRGGASTAFTGEFDLTKLGLMPDTFKLGISASTGVATATHQIRNLKAALPVRVPVTITGPAEIPAGSEVTFRVTAENEGPNDALDAWVEAEFTPELTNPRITVVDTGHGARTGTAEPGSKRSRQQVSLPAGDPPPTDPHDTVPGGTVTIDFTGTVPETATGELTCTASCTSEKVSNVSDRHSASHTTRITEYAPESKVQLTQFLVPQGMPGMASTLGVKVTTTDKAQPAGADKLALVFDAPDGFLWTGWAKVGYYDIAHETEGDSVELTATVENDGRRLLLTGLPDVTKHSNHFPVILLRVKVPKNATPGTHADGSARVGKGSPLTLEGIVLTKDDPRHTAVPK